jgi:glycosyltransferase involved in cell wall biosynthesis
MISVCIPTHNGSKYIIQQLDSILFQLNEKDEIIVSDDSSEDNTCKLIENLNDKRIIIFKENKFSNYILNYENAINHAKGNHIFLCDQDDVWLPNKVDVMCRALNKYDLVVSDCFVTDSNLTILNDSYYLLRNAVRNKFLALALRSPYLGCCMAFNRKILNKALPFPNHINSHDIWLGNIAAFYYSVKFVNEKLIYYRRHSGNTSIMAGTSNLSLYLRLKDRLLTSIQLLTRL